MSKHNDQGHLDTGSGDRRQTGVGDADLPSVSTGRHVQGVVTSFDPAAWWGEIEVGARRLDFHATCLIGASARDLPRAGDAVLVTFSDETQQRLLSVQSIPPRAPRSEHDHDGDGGAYVQPFDRGAIHDASEDERCPRCGSVDDCPDPTCGDDVDLDAPKPRKFS